MEKGQLHIPIDDVDTDFAPHTLFDVVYETDAKAKNLTTALTDINSAIENEASMRSAADTAEASARAGADTTLDGKIYQNSLSITSLQNNTYNKTQVDEMVASAGKVKTVNNTQPDENGNIELQVDVHRNVNTLPSAEEMESGVVYFVEDDTMDDGVPIGIIVPFAGNDSDPFGYLLCNGASVGRSTYPALFDVIGTTYGLGSDPEGATTFNLPDLTSKFIEGAATAGTEIKAGLPNIMGNFGYAVSGGDDTTNGAFNKTFTSEYGTAVSKSETAKVIQENFNASRSSSIYGNSTTVQPPALTMRYYIKAFTGVNPSATEVEVAELANDVATLYSQKADKTDVDLKAPITSPAFLTSATLDGNNLEVVVASGSNENGYYIRYASGIQICWNAKSITSNGQMVGYSQSFIETPIIIGKLQDSYGSFQVGAPDLTKFYTWTMDVTFPVNLNWQAIGKWK